MMNKTISRLKSFFTVLRDKIAFIPTLISIVAFGIGVLLISLRDAELDSFFFKTPLVKIHSLETLRAILTTFLTGLISITIFSFSMVMLVLNQAATHYSPKLLNWMVGKRSNQYTLGVYLGTIIYTIVLLIQLPGDMDIKPSYHFAIVLDAALTFYCLILFVSFINRVSSDIQISHVTESIYVKTLTGLKKEIKECQDDDMRTSNPDQEWIYYSSSESGYLQNITKDSLLKVVVKYDLNIRITQNFGYYHIAGTPLYALNKAEVDQEVLDEINACFLFYAGERIQDHTFYGFRQLSEIAVKALSPGINDPGTASTCIDYLTDLLSYKLMNDLPNIIRDKRGASRIYIHSYSFQELFDMCFIPILNYGRRDLTTLSALIESLEKLIKKDKEHHYFGIFNSFKEAIKVACESHKDIPYFHSHMKKKLEE